MLAKDASKEMYLSFTKGPLRSMRASYSHSRESSGGTYNPVTETTTGGSGGFTSTLDGTLREVRRRIVDGVNITNDMSQLTVLQRTVENVPEVNDKVGDGNAVEYRVVAVNKDPANVFYHLILERAS